MNEFQVACANDPEKQNYRNHERDMWNPESGRTMERKGKNARNLFWRDPSLK
jgi:hypothetical protein